MTDSRELFDTHRVRDHDEHWDALAARIATAATRQGTLGRLADSRFVWVAASALLAAGLALLVLPDASRSSGTGRAEWTQLIAPADDIGRAIAAPDGPPPVGVLVLSDRRGQAP